MKRITHDFETRSAADLRKVGAYKYSLHPTTRATCLAFKVHGYDRIYFLDFKLINKDWILLPEAFRKLWQGFIKNGYEFSAHNSFFERCIYDNILVKRHGWPIIDPLKRRCTAAKAAACALPRSLEGAGEALALAVQKDRRGYQAMMATCKPTKAWTAWKRLQDRIQAGDRMTAKSLAKAASPEPRQFLEYDDAPQVWQVLYEYCRIDVKAEEALDDALPDLIPQEQEVWHLNQKLNWRGLRIDLPTVRKIVAILETDKTEKLEELDKLTMGLVTKPGARQSILDFLELEGIKLPDLRAGTVDEKLRGYELSPDMRRLLEIRKALSLASTKKYYSFLDRACDGERARDLVLYHGASTGRDAGSGINPYNFPRGLIRVDKDRPYAAVENVVECAPPILKLLYGSSLGLVFSAILRNMLIPSPGCELFVADFSKIEVAVLWWLADHEEGLNILRSGLDVYKVQAAKNLGKTYQEISDEGMERQTAKAQILGCGFRMSWKKFRDSSLQIFRLKLTNRQAVDAVKNYRESHQPVVALWDAYESAAVAAVETGQTQEAGHCKFMVERGFLWIELPSGRRLAYREPQIIQRAITYTALEENPHTGEEVEVEKVSKPKKTVQFLGLDKSKKKLQVEFTHGGILTENIVQATARDLMMPALLRLEKRGYRVLLSVYDEGVCEKEKGKGKVDEFVKILCELPPWAEGLPLEAKGWSGPRYRK
jgi:DNA polymerase bacteriophage-type